MEKNKVLKILSYICFGIAAVFMIVAISLCINHLIWNSKGEKKQATYLGHNKISYLSENKYINAEFPDKLVKYVDKDNKVVIIYDKQAPEKFYCVKSISRVFIFAGIGFAFLIGTFVLVLVQGKKPNEKQFDEPVSNIESKMEDDDIFIVKKVDKKEEQNEETLNE